MAAADLNVYVEGNRVKVTAQTATLPDETPTTPTTWELIVRNLADGEVLRWYHNGVAADVLPSGVEAAMDNPDVGIMEFFFDIDTHGKRAVWFGGTGACKCAAEIQFVVKRSEAR